MNALFLPAISSVSTRDEMVPLASRLADTLTATIPDWPGFGDRPRTRDALTPDTLHRFLAGLLEGLPSPLIGIAAGHAATYLVDAARRNPGRFERLVLVAPTWRGPFPTMFGPGRERLLGRIRRALEAPAIGQLLYQLSISRPAVGRMMREHVYADGARVTADLVSAKRHVARQPRGRFGTAAFITGGLDPARSRDAFLALFTDKSLPPMLMLRPEAAPPRSAAEMDALAATGRVAVQSIPGALLAHEEHPEAAAAAIRAFLSPPPHQARPAAPRAETAR